MENPKQTPRPDSDKYEIDQTQKLNTPKYNSSTERRESDELPATENLNEQEDLINPDESTSTDLPETDLGNSKKDDGKDDEMIIRT